jgi:flagellar basal body-associated protein FliL
MSKLPLILGLLNTVAIGAVLGLFVYTKVLYKRPPITEEQERARLAGKARTSVVSPEAKRALVKLDPVTVNLDPFTGPDGKSKVHYAAITLTVEIRDEKEVERFNSAKAVVMDKVIQGLSKKKFEDLNQVQGRYVFRSQIIDSANQFFKGPLVTEIYFSDFLLQ